MKRGIVIHVPDGASQKRLYTFFTAFTIGATKRATLLARFLSAPDFAI
jgi:hypothetical protein